MALTDSQFQERRATPRYLLTPEEEVTEHMVASLRRILDSTARSIPSDGSAEWLRARYEEDVDASRLDAA